MPNKRRLSDILGRGVPDQRAAERTSLADLLKIHRRRDAAASTIRPVQGTTYNDRNWSDGRGNSDYVGPMTGAGSGTRDKMPGTTPSQKHELEKLPRSNPKPDPKKKRTSKKPGLIV